MMTENELKNSRCMAGEVARLGYEKALDQAKKVGVVIEECIGEIIFEFSDKSCLRFTTYAMDFVPNHPVLK